MAMARKVRSGATKYDEEGEIPNNTFTEEDLRQIASELSQEKLPPPPIKPPWLMDAERPFNPDMPSDSRRTLVNPYAPGVREGGETGFKPASQLTPSGTTPPGGSRRAIPNFAEDFAGENLSPVAAMAQDPSRTNFNRLRSSMFAGTPAYLTNPEPGNPQTALETQRQMGDLVRGKREAMVNAMNTIAGNINQQAARKAEMKQAELANATQRMLGTQKNPEESPAEMKSKVKFQAMQSGMSDQGSDAYADKIVAEHQAYKRQQGPTGGGAGQAGGGANAVSTKPGDQVSGPLTAKKLAEEAIAKEAEQSSPVVSEFAKTFSPKTTNDLYQNLVKYSDMIGRPLTKEETKSIATYYGGSNADKTMEIIEGINSRGMIGKSLPDWFYYAPQISENFGNNVSSALRNLVKGN